MLKIHTKDATNAELKNSADLVIPITGVITAETSSVSPRNRSSSDSLHSSSFACEDRTTATSSSPHALGTDQFRPEDNTGPDTTLQLSVNVSESRSAKSSKPVQKITGHNRTGLQSFQMAKTHSLLFQGHTGPNRTGPNRTESDRTGPKKAI